MFSSSVADDDYLTSGSVKQPQILSQTIPAKVQTLKIVFFGTEQNPTELSGLVPMTCGNIITTISIRIRII